MKIIRLSSLFILAVFMITAVSCSGRNDFDTVEGKKKIGLIVRMNYGYHWMTVKMGADVAAKEFNVDVYYNAPYDESDVEGEIKLVNKALDEEKVDALILAANDYKALVGVVEKAYDSGIPVVIIDSEIDTKKIHSYIATDNVEAGKKAGSVLVKYAGEKCKVAIMSSALGIMNVEQREAGIMSILSKYPGIQVVAKEYCYSDTLRATQLTQKIIEDKNVDAIIALNLISAEGVADAVDQMGLEGKVKIIAFDSTSKEIDYLERGVIQATIAQNPFSMGYLGVKAAVDIINNKSVDKFIDTKSKIIDIENMYLPENQKLLFPFVK